MIFATKPHVYDTVVSYMHTCTSTCSTHITHWFQWQDPTLVKFAVPLTSSSPLHGIRSKISIKSIDCGHNFTAAVTTSGRLYTWGQGSRGQLGHGDFSDRCTPVLVQSLRRKIASVGCGKTFCVALMVGGSVYTWGGNALQTGSIQLGPETHTVGRLVMHVCSA